MRRCCIVLLTLVLLGTCIFAGCGGGKGLPDYVSRVSGDSMQIDVTKASVGSAHVDEESMNIIYDRGDYKLIFSLSVFSLTTGIGSHTSITSISNPPVKISPVITPGDDVADFFAAVRIDEETDDLYVTIFIDTDWQDVVEGEIFLHIHEVGNIQEVGLSALRTTVETIDFSKAVDGIFMRELRFRADDNFGDYDLSPSIFVTNITGNTEDLFYKIGRLEVSMNHVVISISPQVVEQ